MGRTLPWKKKEDGTPAKNESRSAASSSTSTSTTTAKTPPRRGSPSAGSSSRLGAHEASPKPNHAVDNSAQDQGQEQAHPPNTPPRQPQPVPERLMIAGLRHDDKWRMVEDEFVAVAHKYTAHLHAAEYQRLRDRATQQKSDAIRSISRPASGPMSDSVKRRHVALSLSTSQSRGIKRALSRAGEADEAGADDMSWAGTNLQDLMNSPRKRPVPLTRFVAAVPSTRAAALHRQNSISTRQSSLSDTMVDHRGARNQQVGSPLTDRTAFVRAQGQIHVEYDVLERPSVSERLAQHISSASRTAIAEPGLQSTAPGRASAPARATPVHVTASTQKSTAVPIIPNEDDSSDSSMETFFDRRMRERRAERKAPKRKQSHPTDAATEESQPHQRSQVSQVMGALSVPSL